MNKDKYYYIVYTFMARELQVCRYIVLVLFLGFVMVFSTIQARTLNAPNYNHAMMKPMSPSQAKQGHYFVGSSSPLGNQAKPNPTSSLLQRPK